MEGTLVQILVQTLAWARVAHTLLHKFETSLTGQSNVILVLTFMLLLAMWLINNFKISKMTDTLAHVYLSQGTQRDQSNVYQYDRV